jgi:hypothetical protein
MTRLALAKTIVSGTVTLQGNTYTFTGSGSATATADRVPEAKKLAVATSNTAAISVARASIDKILADNSAVLSDLEITSLISNNLSTTVRAFVPIGLETIATTTDGINYFANTETTIESDQWLTVPNGKTITFNAPGKNYGYVQIGEGRTGLSSSKIYPDEAQATYNQNYDNYVMVIVETGSTCTINASFNNQALDAILTNFGTCTLTNNKGYIYNNYTTTGVINAPNGVDIGSIATFNNYETIQMNGTSSFVTNGPYGVFNNTSGNITCGGSDSYTSNYGTWNGPQQCAS